MLHGATATTATGRAAMLGRLRAGASSIEQRQAEAAARAALRSMALAAAQRAARQQRAAARVELLAFATRAALAGIAGALVLTGLLDALALALAL